MASFSMKSVVGGLACSLLFSGVALADPSNWTGPYVGVSGGYSWSGVSGIFDSAGQESDIRRVG